MSVFLLSTTPQNQEGIKVAGRPGRVVVTGRRGSGIRRDVVWPTPGLGVDPATQLSGTPVPRRQVGAKPVLAESV